MESITDKKMLEHMYNLKSNPAFHFILKHLNDKFSDITKDLLEQHDPDEIVLTHALWKSLNMVIKEVETLPTEYIENTNQSLEMEFNF